MAIKKKRDKKRIQLNCLTHQKKLKVLADKYEIKIILCTTQCHKTGSIIIPPAEVCLSCRLSAMMLPTSVRLLTL